MYMARFRIIVSMQKVPCAVCSQISPERPRYRVLHKVAEFRTSIISRTLHIFGISVMIVELG